MTAFEFAPSIDVLIAYVLACVVVIVVPGPSVSLIIANTLSHGARAGLMNILGGQVGQAIMILLVAFGLDLVLSQAGFVFKILRYIGAAYLVWLGWKIFTSKPFDFSVGQGVAGVGKRRFFIQGFVVVCFNPKVLLFFGAFIPQFVVKTQNAFPQVMFLGLIFIVLALCLDSIWVLLFGRIKSLLNTSRIMYVNRISGTALMGGGCLLALQRKYNP